MKVKKNRLYLTGFMGCGKSTLQEFFATQLTANCLDLDDLVFERLADQEMAQVQAKDLGESIQKVGWQVFREAEKTLLFELLESEPASWCEVIALGGGSLNQQFIERLKSRQDDSCFHRLLWLDVPFEICWQRISQDQSRPLAAKGQEYCRQLYQQRQEFYQQADVRLGSEALDTLFSYSPDQLKKWVESL